MEDSSDKENEKKDKEDKDIYLNAWEAVNDAVWTLDANILKHQARQREKI